MVDSALHAVLQCDDLGIVQCVLSSNLLDERVALSGRTLPDLVVPKGQERAREVLAALHDVGVVFDRLLTLDLGGSPVRSHVAGVRVGGAYLVAFATSPEDALHVLRTVLPGVEGTETALLRYVLQDRLVLMQRRDGDRERGPELEQMHTDRVTTHDDLERRQYALEQHDRQRDEFVSMAAHELRNPLSTIRFYSGCLLDLDLSEDKQRHFISIIQETSAFMGHLIEELLTVSAVEAGHLTLELEEADVCDVAFRCYEVHRLVAEEKRIHLDLVGCASAITAMVDADKVVQVLNNLLSNAIKFSEPGTEIVMRLTAQPDLVGIAVEDQGPGIPPDEVPLLFKPFQRTSVRSTAGERSTGLGLSICRNIVDRHGGRLWVESEVGHGSTFYVELPRYAKAVPLDEAETVRLVSS